MLGRDHIYGSGQLKVWRCSELSCELNAFCRGSFFLSILVQTLQLLSSHSGICKPTEAVLHSLLVCRSLVVPYLDHCRLVQLAGFPTNDIAHSLRFPFARCLKLVPHTVVGEIRIPPGSLSYSRPGDDKKGHAGTRRSSTSAERDLLCNAASQHPSHESDRPRTVIQKDRSDPSYRYIRT